MRIPFRESPVPQLQPPNYFVDEYKQEKDDGFCCQCQAATMENVLSCMTRCKFAFVKDLMDTELLDNVRENWYEWKKNEKPDDSYNNIAFEYRLFGSWLNYGRTEYVLPSGKPWVTDELLLNKPTLGIIKDLYQRIGFNRKATLEVSACPL